MSIQRWLFVCGFASCVGLIVTALYFQHVMGLEPCPLCIIQRLIVMSLGLVMLVGAIHGPSRLGRRIYAGFTVAIAGLGVAVAGRHVWLQNLPPERVPECGPGLEYLLDAFPLREALKIVLEGSGECAEIQWTFLGLTIPGWTLLVFCALVVFGLYLSLTRPELDR